MDLLQARDGTPVYGLDRHIICTAQLGMVFEGIIFTLVSFVTQQLSLESVPLLYQLKFKCLNAQLHKKQIIC